MGPDQHIQDSPLTFGQNILQMGWGQGGDQVVDFLETRAIDRPITVQTSAVPSAFTYFLSDESNIRFRGFPLNTPAGWFETDFYVSGIQQYQRGLDPARSTLEQFEPIHSVDIGGVPYFQIYNVRYLPLPNTLKAATACNYTFGERVTLMQIIGRKDSIDFYWLSLDGAESASLTIQVTLTGPDGVAYTTNSTLLPQTVGLMNRTTVPLVHSMSTEEIQALDIEIRVEVNGNPLPVLAPWQSGAQNYARLKSECYYAQPHGN